MPAPIDVKIVARILSLYKEEWATGKIAAELGLAKATVQRSLRKSGIDLNKRELAPKPLPTHKVCFRCPEKGLQAIEKFASYKMKDGTIAIQNCLECTNKAKKEAWHKKYGPPKFQRTTKQTASKIGKMYVLGFAISKIVAVIGITDMSIRKILRKRGHNPAVDWKNTIASLTAKISALANGGMSTRKIAKELNIDRGTVQSHLRNAGIDVSKRLHPRKSIPTEKSCKTCQQVKKTDQFRQRVKGDRISYEPYCLSCEADHRHARAKEKLESDPRFKIRLLISNHIRIALNKQGISKDNESSIKYLPFTTDELVTHFEFQFEPWMTWQNHGLYIPSTWDDNDSTTWTWQIDHIIPHSTFKYTSMEDESFRQCWSLSNLRPLSAKQNNEDGVNRTRHNIA
jgi:predicted transcriptional regulator